MRSFFAGSLLGTVQAALAVGSHEQTRPDFASRLLKLFFKSGIVLA